MKTINWFLAWIERTELAVQVVVQEIRRDGGVFSFEGWPCLKGAVQPWGISVWAYRSEEPWDGVLDIDIHPVERHGRWVCGLCWDAFESSLYPEPQSYPAAEELWMSHCIEPFAEWCNEKLARSIGVGFWDFDGVLEAKIVFSEDDAGGAVEVTRRSRSMTR